MCEKCLLPHIVDKIGLWGEFSPDLREIFFSGQMCYLCVVVPPPPAPVVVSPLMFVKVQPPNITVAVTMVTSHTWSLHILVTSKKESE